MGELNNVWHWEDCASVLFQPQTVTGHLSLFCEWCLNFPQHPKHMQLSFPYPISTHFLSLWCLQGFIPTGAQFPSCYSPFHQLPKQVFRLTVVTFLTHTHCQFILRPFSSDFALGILISSCQYRAESFCPLVSPDLLG